MDVLIGEIETLPNLKGTFSKFIGVNYTSPTGVFDYYDIATISGYGASGSGSVVLSGFSFDSSKFSSVYRNNAKVRPHAITLRYWKRRQ